MKVSVPLPAASTAGNVWKPLVVLAGLLLVLGFIVWTRNPWHINHIFTCDEAHEAIVADRWLDGLIPYRDTLEHRGPLTAVLFALLFLLGQRYNFRALHKALTGLHLLTAVLIFRIASLLGDAGAGVFSAACFAVFSILIGGPDAATFHANHLAMLFSAAGVWLYVSGVMKARPLSFLGSGALFACAFLSKQPAGMDFAAALVFLFVLGKIRSDFRVAAGYAALMCGGFLAVFLAAAGYFYLHGAFKEFWFYFWTFNTRFYIPAQPLGERILSALAYPFVADPFNPNMFRKGWIASFCLVAFVMRLFAGKPPGETPPQQLRRMFGFFLLLWFLFSYGGFALSGRRYSQYFLQCIPPLSIISGIMFSEWWGWGVQLWKKNRQARGEIIVLLVFVTLYSGYWGRQLLARSEAYSHWSWNPLATDVTRYIQSNSQPRDSIFIWGFYPEFYAAARRRPASRYTVTSPLTGILLPHTLDPEGKRLSPEVPGAWDLLMQDLEASMPALILDTAPGNLRGQAAAPVEKYPRLKAFLEAHYRLDTTFTSEEGLPQFSIYKRISENSGRVS